MVGKTNLTFISKGDASSVQLVQKSYVTDATSAIWKMEIINGKIFAFDSGNVMMGTSMDNLEFLRKGQEYLRADHIIYNNGKYYVAEADAECEIHTTRDFVEYGKVELGEELTGKKNVGIFLDSADRIVFACYDEENWWIYRCSAAGDVDLRNADMVTVEMGSDKYDKNRTYFIDNKISWVKITETIIKESKNRITYQVNPMGKLASERRNVDFFSHAAGYFFYEEISDDRTEIYRCRGITGAGTICQGMGWSNAVTHRSEHVIPINGKICRLFYSPQKGRSAFYIADDILDIGNSSNASVECYDDILVSSVLEYDGKTYVASGNIIYEFALDYEGIIQRPDVAIIKTLAAKQALEQSLQYTDDCVEKLRNYIDSKLEGGSADAENNSTEVES